MDFDKIVEAAKMPAAILIGISILGDLLTLIPGIGIVISLALGMLSMVLTPVILAWAGFEYAKKYNNADFVAGAAVGGVVGVVSAIVEGVVSIIFAMIGFGAALSSGMDGMGGAAIGALTTGVMIIGLVIGTIATLIVGLVCGAIGAFLSKHI